MPGTLHMRTPDTLGLVLLDTPVLLAPIPSSSRPSSSNSSSPMLPQVVVRTLVATSRPSSPLLRTPGLLPRLLR